MEAASYAELLGKLGTGYLDATLRSAERYTRLVGGALQPGAKAGASDADRVPQRYAEFVRVEAPKVMGQIAEAGLGYYKLVLECGLGVMDRFVEQVLRPAAAAAAAPAPAAAPAAGAAPSAAGARLLPPTMLFRGRFGDRPGNAFVVANHRAEAVDVSFQVTELASDDGGPAVRPKLEFTPASLRLAPHSEQVIQCACMLTNDYRPGVAHRAQIHVAGFPEMTIRMSVQVDADVPVPQPPAAAPGRAGPAAKRPRSRR